MIRNFEIYTDGACKGNGTANSFGGWAYIILEDRKIVKQNSGGPPDATTNNKMELQAVVEALKNFVNAKVKHKITVYSDSAYVVNCFNDKWYIKWQNNNWRGGKGEVVNKALWQELIDLYNKLDVTFVKVAGHSGDEFNELVDTMASGYASKKR